MGGSRHSVENSTHFFSILTASLSEIRLPDIEYNSKMVPRIKKRSQRVRNYVSTLSISEVILSERFRFRGYCCYVKFSSDKISINDVSLYPGDVTRLQQFLFNSQYQSWSVKGSLCLYDLESDSDLEGAAEILQSLDSVSDVEITSNCQLSTTILRQLWDKTSDTWEVREEEVMEFNKSDVRNFI